VECSLEKLKQIISNFQNNIEVELQQRSCEYSKLFNWDGVRKILLERIPVIEEKKEIVTSTIAIKPQGGNSLIEMWDSDPSPSPTAPTKATVTPVAPTPIIGGGMDIFGDIFGTVSVPTPTNVSRPAPSTADSLLDLLGPSPISPSPNVIPGMPSMLPPVMSIPQMASSTPTTPLNGPLPTVTAFEKAGLSILFDPVKNAQFPNITVINITFLNSSAFPLVNFDFKAAVPKYLKLQVNPPSGNLIPPNNSGNVTQSIKLMNSEQGQKPLVLKIKIDYLVNGAPVSEVADVNFPPGV